MRENLEADQAALQELLRNRAHQMYEASENYNEGEKAAKLALINAGYNSNIAKKARGK